MGNGEGNTYGNVSLHECLQNMLDMVCGSSIMQTGSYTLPLTACFRLVENALNGSC